MSDFSYSWQNVTVQATEKRAAFWRTTKQLKIILDNVNGIAYSNSLIAILGASGSGKTTFLGAVSGRVKGTSGTLKLNGRLLAKDDVKSLSSYVHQHDIFTNTLTVLEYLQFMTALQLRQKDRDEQVRIIDDLMSELGLEHHKNTTIMRLSGGEKRRLSLGGSLLNNPQILFCDEPTTGLDSFSAITVIKKLQKVASTGKIVLTTIHQPSSELFEYFNNIVLLAGGRLVFEGTKTEAKEFFESFDLSCPISYNPADFYIKNITILQDYSTKRQVEKVLEMCEIFKMRRKPLAEISAEINLVNFKKEKTGIKYFGLELRWLTWRCALDTRRNLTHNMVGYACLMITSVVVSSVYGLVVLGQPNSVQNIQGSLFFLASELIFTNMFTVIYVFPNEMDVFLREKSLYSPLPYFLSKLLSMVPLSLLSSASLMAIFFLTQKFLNGFVRYLLMVSVLFWSALCACTIGLSFSALCSSIEFAEIALTPLEIMLMVTSGIYIKLDSLPWFFQIFKYFSPFFYAFESISNIYWQDVTQIGNCTGVPCYRNGLDVLTDYQFYHDYNVVAFDVFSILVLIILYCIIGFLGILRKSHSYNAY